MPVSVLLCEGGTNSPDVRVLSKVLAGLCEVRPFGGKYGMGDRILARRESIGQNVVYGLLDGDFCEWQPLQDSPKPWLIQNNKVQLGWRWQRKEIENYLIDPAVVERVFGNIPGGYELALATAATKIASYQAARIALTLIRPRFTPLSNSFGKAHGRYKHVMPDDLARDSCLQEAEKLVREWNVERAIDDVALQAAFANAETECSPAGGRLKDFITSFAGKDLLWSMDKDLKTLGLDSSTVFLERVLTKLGESTEVWEWLPEWKALRQVVATMP